MASTAAIERNPLHADLLRRRGHASLACAIVENVRLARDTYRVRFECPEIARRIVPGQFLMLRLAGMNDPLLGRPLALVRHVRDRDGTPIGDRRRLSHARQDDAPAGAACSRATSSKSGDRWATAFRRSPTEHLIMVAGGIGQTPFLALGQEYLGLRHYGDPPRRVPRAKRVTLCYGVRTAELLAGVADFERPASTCASAATTARVGHHGFVTDAARATCCSETHGEDRLVVCCGPEPMMDAVAELAGATTRRARCRWKRRWPAASASASAAWRRSASRTASWD